MFRRGEKRPIYCHAYIQKFHYCIENSWHTFRSNQIVTRGVHFSELDVSVRPCLKWAVYMFKLEWFFVATKIPFVEITFGVRQHFTLLGASGHLQQLLSVKQKMSKLKWKNISHVIDRMGTETNCVTWQIVYDIVMRRNVMRGESSAKNEKRFQY